ncbi:hypothetical protein C8R43DRAFT_1161058 [Mycena crocata]|nr:hypothetical protein C8R43DRAFT_1161058 [Mycena crocata]
MPEQVPADPMPMALDGDIVLLDRELGGFLASRERSERHFAAELEQARLNSLREMHVDDPARDPPSSAESSRSRRPTTTGGSPPKRPRIDTSVEPRITRSRSAAQRDGQTSAVPTTFASVVANPAPAPVNATTLAQPAAPPAMTGNSTAPAQPPAGATPAAPAAAAAPAPAANPGPAALQVPGAPAIYGTADNLPPRTHYLAYPAARPTGISPRTLLGPASSAQLDLWRILREQGTPGVYAWRAGGSVDRTTEAQLFGPEVEGILNLAPGTVTIGAASPAAQNGLAPNLFYITGPAQHLLDVLIAASLLSTAPISFYVTPTDIPVDGFLGIVEGLLLPNTPAGAVAVRTAVQNGMRSNSGFTNAVLALRDAAGPHVPAQQTLADTIASTRVTAIELAHGAGTWTCWQVYITPATLSHDHQEAVRVSFQNTTVLTFQSEGRVRTGGLFCTNCRSTDHPTPLCTDPNRDGYMGDPLASVIARGAGANRGGRGGGPSRARGGGRGGNGNGNRARGARGRGRGM